jgi:hypothetical protein
MSRKKISDCGTVNRTHKLHSPYVSTRTQWHDCQKCGDEEEDIVHVVSLSGTSKEKVQNIGSYVLKDQKKIKDT